MKRESGILLSISSLPSRYGIGCFSKEAYEFVDQLKQAGQSCWQILPLGPTSYGDSPYQSFSTFAGNPYFISLEDLIEEGVLTERNVTALTLGRIPGPWTMQRYIRNVFPSCALPMSAATSARMRNLNSFQPIISGGLKTTPCSWP